MSPVSPAYKKEGLVDADSRVKMCALATEGHQWLSVDNYEALNTTYVPTAQCRKSITARSLIFISHVWGSSPILPKLMLGSIVDHFAHELKQLGGLKAPDGQRQIRVALLVLKKS